MSPLRPVQPSVLRHPPESGTGNSSDLFLLPLQSWPSLRENRRPYRFPNGSSLAGWLPLIIAGGLLLSPRTSERTRRNCGPPAPTYLRDVLTYIRCSDWRQRDGLNGACCPRTLTGALAGNRHSGSACANPDWKEPTTCPKRLPRQGQTTAAARRATAAAIRRPRRPALASAAGQPAARLARSRLYHLEFRPRRARPHLVGTLAPSSRRAPPRCFMLRARPERLSPCPTRPGRPGVGTTTRRVRTRPALPGAASTAP